LVDSGILIGPVVVFDNRPEWAKNMGYGERHLSLWKTFKADTTQHKKFEGTRQMEMSWDIIKGAHDE